MQIAVAQLNYKIGDFEGNFSKIAHIIQQHANQCDLIIFSELCLSGYYPKDLISQPGFLQAQDQVLQKVKLLTKQYSIAVILGIVKKNEGKGQPYFNSLCFLENGNSEYTYHKKLLPVYNIFNEARHFAPGKTPGLYQFKHFNFGFLICEDGWAGLDNFLYDCNPVDDLVEHSLDAIICINGSPSNVGKQRERVQHFSAIAKRCNTPLIFSNQVGGNDDIVFDGASFILDKEGNLLGSLKLFQEDTGTFSLESKEINITSGFTQTQDLQDVELFYQQTILGLQDYVKKCNFKSVVIGVSGGIDSALTLALAVKALGSDKVYALAMPSRYSLDESLKQAKILCETFNVKMFTVSIEQEFTLSLSQFHHSFGEKAHSITEQNIQARLRGRILMEYSNQTGALVLSTGNKSEISVGYTTLYGDMTGGLNLIGDLYKTDVYNLATYFNQLNPTTPIPRSIIERAPSAELAPNQKDSDTLPEYTLLDPILKLYIEGDLLPPQEIKEYLTITQKLPSELIARIHRMVDLAEFKRRQSPPIIRVQRRAFGFGRQLPIAATYPTF